MSRSVRSRSVGGTTGRSEHLTSDPVGETAAGPGARVTSAWSLAAMAVLIVTLLAVVPVFTLHDGDVTTFLRVGEEAPSREVVESDFDEVHLFPGYGHDGQQFYVLATAFPDLRSADGDVDNLPYRARRILVPALASPAPDGTGTVVALVLLNLIAVAAATAAAARIARQLGVTPLVALAVPVTPCVIDSVRGCLADAPALALALWGVSLFRERPWLAAVLLSGAVLSRETAITAVVGCILASKGWRARLVVAIPFAVFAVWALFIALALPEAAGAKEGGLIGDALEQFQWPLQGWFDAGTQVVVFGAMTVVASLLAAWILRRDLPEMSVWLVLDLLVAIVSAEMVVQRLPNFNRVTPVALFAVALALANQRGRAPVQH